MKALKSSYYLFLCLIIMSCCAQYVVKGYGSTGLKVSARVVKHTKFYLDTTANRIEARETLGNVIALLIKKSRGGHDYDCFNRPMPNIELIIEKPKGQRISEDEILQVIKDSFGYVIEKQDFWIEKMKIELLDSVKLKAKQKLFRGDCMNYELPVMGKKISRDPGVDTIYSSLEGCLDFIPIYYQPSDEYGDTLTKEGIYLPDVNQHRVFEYKKYNQEILPYEVEFEIGNSFNPLKYYCADFAIHNYIAGNLGNLNDFLRWMGIALHVKIERRTYSVLKCIAPIPGQ